MLPKFLNDKENQLVLFDMDGVLVEFNPNSLDNVIKKELPNAYLDKRPIKTMIDLAEKIYNMSNVKVGILSSCECKMRVSEKKSWLKKYLPFLDDELIFIIVWEEEKYTSNTRSLAKLEKIQRINNYDKIYLIEDNLQIIEATNKKIPNCAHHISEFLD